MPLSRNLCNPQYFWQGVPTPLELRRRALQSFSPRGASHELPNAVLERFLRDQEDEEVMHAQHFRMCRFGWFREEYIDKKRCRGILLDRVYLDTPFNFLLASDETFLALLGFTTLDASFSEARFLLREVYPFYYLWQRWLDSFQHRAATRVNAPQDFPSDVMVVVQLQGKRGTKEHIAPLRWEKLLLDRAVSWAFSNGFEEVRVVSAENNKYYGDGPEQRHHSMKLRYDVTPKRMGFTPSSCGGYSFLRK